MDGKTHIILAAKLLEKCGCDPGAAIYSILPTIDRKPAYHHRVYAHFLENVPAILEAARAVLSHEVMREAGDCYGDNIYEKKASLYASQRIREEIKGFMEEYIDETAAMIDSDITKINNDRLSAAVSLISHLYFDTYNNPVQAFIPWACECSAQYDFWRKIDYMAFRTDFFERENIELFRQMIIHNNIWKKHIGKPLNPCGMIKAMIVRLGEMAPGIENQVVDKAIHRILGYIDSDNNVSMDSEISFCRDLETEITGIISKNYSRR
jgi:hypothetical protein